MSGVIRLNQLPNQLRVRFQPDVEEQTVQVNLAVPVSCQVVSSDAGNRIIADYRFNHGIPDNLYFGMLRQPVLEGLLRPELVSAVEQQYPAGVLGQS